MYADKERQTKLIESCNWLCEYVDGVDVFRVTDGERWFSCESYYDHFVLRPEDGSEPWETVELSMHGLRKC